MLGLGLGFGKLSSYKYTVKKLIDDYIKRVTAAGGYLEGNECATAKVRELNSQRLLDDASWLLIPEGIKEDVVYTQKPTNGLGDLQFTRASDATRTNSAGVIERTPWNLFTFSEDFSNAAWTKPRATVTANTTTAPNGTLTADTITADVGTATTYFVDSTTATGTGNFTASIFAKKGSADWLYIRQGNSSGGTSLVRAWFDLNTGTIGSTSPAAISHSIEDYGNGWYRCSMTFSVLSGGVPRPQFNLSTGDGVVTFDSDGSQFFYLWAAQLVEGTDAKPYFATTNRQDVPRLDYRNADGTLSTCPRLLLEPQRTNSIRNSTMVGAVAGSPGTDPTNWSVGTGGLTQTIVGIGTENGLQYIEYRFNGTSNSTVAFFGFDQISQIAAANGQTWTNSSYVKLIAQPTPPLSYALTIREGTSGGGFVAATQQTFTPTTSLVRYTQVRTIPNATTAFVQPQVRFNLTNGATYDFTIRIAAPQMELGAYATTFIPTTTAAVTRLADAASKTGVSSIIGQTEGTLFFDFVPTNVTAINAFGVSNGTSANRVIVYTTSGTLAALVTAAGVNVFVSSTSAVIGTRYKAALTYKANDFAFYVNGNQILTGSTGSVPANSLITFSTGDGNTAFTGTVNQAALFPTRLTTAQLVDITGGRIYYNPVEAYYAYYLTPEIPSAVITSVNSFF
jgi:hypothetical protein